MIIRMMEIGDLTTNLQLYITSEFDISAKIMIVDARYK